MVNTNISSLTPRCHVERIRDISFAATCGSFCAHTWERYFYDAKVLHLGCGLRILFCVIFEIFSHKMLRCSVAVQNPVIT